jgi:hypothetical protein
MDPVTGLQAYGRQLALPSNIKLVWRRLPVTNTLAYFIFFNCIAIIISIIISIVILMDPVTGLQAYGRHMALPSNIKLGWS